MALSNHSRKYLGLMLGTTRVFAVECDNLSLVLYGRILTSFQACSGALNVSSRSSLATSNARSFAAAYSPLGFSSSSTAVAA